MAEGECRAHTHAHARIHPQLSAHLLTAHIARMTSSTLLHHHHQHHPGKEKGKKIQSHRSIVAAAGQDIHIWANAHTHTHMHVSVFICL